MTCLNAFAGKSEKSSKTWKSNEQIVMNEELVQKIVMKAKIDQKVVMDLSMFLIGGWYILQPINQKMLVFFFDENELWFLIGIPSREPLFVTHYSGRHSVSSNLHMKKLMSIREGFHLMMQCYMRQ